MLFISEDGNRFGMSVGERADVHIRVEIVPRVEYKMKSDDVLTVKIRNGCSPRSVTLATVTGEAGSNTVSFMPDDTKDIRPGVYTVAAYLTSPTNGYELKHIWPKPKQKDINENNVQYSVNNFMLTRGGGEL